MRLTSTFKFFMTNIQPPHELSEVQFNNSFIPEFYFMENMESMYLVGEITVDDHQGFFETINFTGQEGFKLIIQQELSGEKSGEVKQLLKVIEFDIYDMSINKMKFKNNRFNFKLIEKGGFDFYGTNFSKGYNNKKISDIITDVMTTQLKLSSTQFEVEPTYDILQNFCIPFWKPALTIKYLRRKARRLASPHEGGYIFFSTTGNETNKTPIKRFISFSSILEKPFDNTDLNTYTFKNFDVNPMFINNIKEARSVTYGKRNIQQDGIGGKRYFGIDYNTDSNIIDLKQKYSEFISKAKLVGKIAYFDKTIDSVNDEVDFIGGDRETIQSQQDNSFRMLLESYNKREVIVEGALFRYAGQVIFIEQLSDKPEGLYHKHDFGKWLIKGITHHYKDGVFMQKLILIKDAYTDTDLTSINLIKK